MRRRQPQKYILRNVETGTILAHHVQRAGSLWARTVGLLGQGELAADEGMWLVPCNGVHTVGMRFALDVLTLDTEGRVVSLQTDVPPNRFCRPVRGGRSVVELTAGTLQTHGVQVGDRLELRPVSESTSDAGSGISPPRRS